PLDAEAIVESATRTSLIVTVEDHLMKGGLYACVAETLLESGTRAQVLPFALAGRSFRPALLEDVISYEGFSGEQLASKIIRRLEQNLGSKSGSPRNSGPKLGPLHSRSKSGPPPNSAPKSGPLKSRFKFVPPLNPASKTRPLVNSAFK